MAGIMKADTRQLRTVLEIILRRHIADFGRIVRLESNRCVDQTSFDLVDIVVELENGTVLRILLKDLGKENLHETARRVKPAFLYNPLREIETYQKILAPNRLGTAYFYGAVVSPNEDRYWLLLEKVAGLRLSQVNDYSDWLNAARWLAQLHSRFTKARGTLNRLSSLLHYDASFYQLWLQRIEEFQSIPLRRSVWNALVDNYERAIERLIRLPSTFIHGEFYASNILVREASDGFRICPVDWETAAVGPGLVDLAALTSGAWSVHERTGMAAAYLEALFPESTPEFSLDDLLLALDDCRLHLAVRWLGWAADWSPPRENAHDWLAEALDLSEKMTMR
jgi:thiamine kinase-like enzyme